VNRATPLLLVCAIAPALTAQASECDYRFDAVLEASWQQARAAPLNMDRQQFSPQSNLAAALRLDQRCDLGGGYGTRLKATAAGALTSHHAGSEQSSARAHLDTWVHEAYLTAAAPGGVWLDIGKKDIRNGYLLFLSPMDILRAPIDPGSHAVLNHEGPSWRTSYREGRIGVGAARYFDWGTLELAAIPALGSRRSERPLAKWSSWQRGNERGMGYLAWSANLWSSFNPKLVARASSHQRHAIAFGVSDALTDAVIFTVEVAQSSHSQVRAVTQEAADLLLAGGFPAGAGLLARAPGHSRQLAAGVRVNGPWQTTLIGEFYYQTDGYRPSDWARYFQFADYAHAAYAASGFAPYLDYQRLLLAAADADQRRYVLLGRRYLTLGLEHSAGSGERFGWHASVLGNVDDHSALLDFHLTGQLTPGTEVYLGGRAMLGRKHSEFGRYGQSPLLYLGVDIAL